MKVWWDHFLTHHYHSKKSDFLSFMINKVSFFYKICKRNFLKAMFVFRILSCFSKEVYQDHLKKFFQPKNGQHFPSLVPTPSLRFTPASHTTGKHLSEPLLMTSVYHSVTSNRSGEKTETEVDPDSGSAVYNAVYFPK